MKKLFLLFLLINPFIKGLNGICFAQNVGINATGAAPNSAAMLDVDANNKGILIPRLNLLQRNAIASPPEGLQIYNLDCHNFNFYNGTAWVDMLGNPLVVAPATGTHVPSQTQIVWNWNAVSGATGYKWNVTDDYGTATDMSTATTKTETGLTCGNTYTRYVWTYNSCGVSAPTTLTQTTSTCCSSPLVDSRDSKSYNILLVGTQCWMAQNLDYGTFVSIGTGQGAGGTQKYCYSNNPANCTTCGALYEWAELMNGSAACNGTGAGQPACNTPVQGICPSGWHIPSHYEWTLFEKNISSNPGVFTYDATPGWPGTDEGNKMKTTSGWNTNTGTNTTGFSAVPGGTTWSGGFGSIGDGAYLWSCSETGIDVWNRYLHHNISTINRGPVNKMSGGSVRCVKD